MVTTTKRFSEMCANRSLDAVFLHPSPFSTMGGAIATLTSTFHNWSTDMRVTSNITNQLHISLERHSLVVVCRCTCCGRLQCSTSVHISHFSVLYQSHTTTTAHSYMCKRRCEPLCYAFNSQHYSTTTLCLSIVSAVPALC